MKYNRHQADGSAPEIASSIMIHRSCALALAVVCLLIRSLGAQAPQPGPRAPRAAAPASATAEFQPLIERTFTARSARRVDILAGNYAPDGGPFFDLAPLRHDAWAAYRAGLEEQFGRFASLTLVPGRDLKASRAGTIAWTAVTVRGSGSRRDGAPVAFEARHTAVWSRQKGEWRIVHEHFSVPTPLAAGVPEPTAAAPGEEEAVRAVFREYEEAFNAGDADRLAALWDELGDVSSLATGGITTGREEVRKLWMQSIARRAQQKTPTTLAVRVAAVRFLTPTIALADGSFEYRAGQAAAAEERYSSVVVKTRDGWKIGSARVAPVQSPPSAR